MNFSENLEFFTVGVVVLDFFRRNFQVEDEWLITAALGALTMMLFEVPLSFAASGIWFVMFVAFARNQAKRGFKRWPRR